MGDNSKTALIASLVLGAAIVWAAYSFTEARFTVQPAGGIIYRLDTHTGELWACTHVGCWPVPINTKTIEQSAADAQNDAAATQNAFANQVQLWRQQGALPPQNSN